MHIKIFKLFILFFIVHLNAFAQSNFYALTHTQNIQIYFSQPDWESQLHALKLSNGGYLQADSIIINDTVLNSIGVKFKGSSSYDATYAKNPFHICLDQYQTQNYQGYTDIKLSNHYQDPSMLREVLSYNILSHYMQCSKANFAELYINGVYIGLYANTEDVNKTFCAQRFLSQKSNTFIKCNPENTPGPQVKSNLKYISADSTDYFSFYRLKSDYGWQELVALCNTISNNPNLASGIIDIDRVIWMLAFNNLTVNLDSYSGCFAQNYYLFKDNKGVFNPIVWDLNMNFGGFPFAGTSNSSMGALSIQNMKAFPVDFHANDPYWPLINIVMQNPQYKRKYIAHMRTIMDECFKSGYYVNLSQQLASIIDTSVAADTNKFFSYQQFQNALIADIYVGNYAVPGIANLMEERIDYLQNQPEFTAIPPVIENINGFYDNANTTAYIQAEVSNASQDGVYMGFRLNIFQKFTQFPMFDDGMHFDGLANDNIYGAVIAADFASSQFYIYAENNNAGIFSPQRAEHEFYNLADIVSAKENFNNGTTKISIVYNHTQHLIIIQSDNSQKIFVNITDMAGKTVFSGLHTSPVFIDTKKLKSAIYAVMAGSYIKNIYVSN